MKFAKRVDFKYSCCKKKKKEEKGKKEMNINMWGDGCGNHIQCILNYHAVQ